ncbi:ADP-ribosylglycohydrolase family protein [Nocardia sp. NBC_00565]|uniref:ADP-ribosylglycohydrolase family protein n=1 Tax=Nocardia sp. NBC_00565 TaxID=2975993 RepID=UPI002E82387F|nr:ADP-ribosylglycohydrolase family protein [Nocardia sp. NBC_00565]WUC01883.1 ADP-ribosylglycohydrolase family protein [Nocardia sp. NBC_00565]
MAVREDEKLFDRVRGAMLGGAVGDALGWPIEFLQLAQIRERHGVAGVTDFLPGLMPDAPQQITDDTQMTLFTAEGLLRCPPGADPAPVLRRAYLRWLTTQEEAKPAPEPDGWLAGRQFLYAMRSPGHACTSGLRLQAKEYRAPHLPGEPGPVNPNSKGCGTVMRSAPFGLAALGPHKAFDAAMRCAQLTHGHPTGYLAAGAFAALIDSVLGGVELPIAVRDIIIRLTSMPADSSETVSALTGALAFAHLGPPTPERVEQVGQGWVAEECLAIAVYCALYAFRTGDVRGALLLSVNHSGDSDSTGAVAGNLIGAAHGLSALPHEWVSAVEGRDELVQIADDLVLNFFYRDRSRLGTRYPPDTSVN